MTEKKEMIPFPAGPSLQFSLFWRFIMKSHRLCHAQGIPHENHRFISPVYFTGLFHRFISPFS